MIGLLLIIRKNNYSVNLGLIGAGKWGTNYIRLIQNMSEINLCAISTKNNNYSNYQSTFSNGLKYYNSWKEICNIKNLNGIIIATPPDKHIEIATYAINNDLPVLIEKPLSLDIDEANEFYKKIINKKAKAMVNFIHQFNPIYLEMKNQIKNMGGIKSIESIGGDWGPFRIDTPPLWDWGCHDIAMSLDLIERIPKRLSKEIIKGEQKHLFPKSQPPQNVKILLEFSNNINAKILVGNLMKIKRRYIRINYENAFIEFDDIKKLLSVTNSSGTRKIEKIPNMHISPLESVIRHFIELIINGNNGNIDLAVKVTEILSRLN